MSDSLAQADDEESAIKYQILLEKVIIALTSAERTFTSEENFLLPVRTLCRNLRPELLPAEMYGFFLNRLVERLNSSLSSVGDGARTLLRNTFPFAAGVLSLLPHFFNVSMRQARLEIGFMQHCTSDVLRERTLELFSKKTFFSPIFAAELLDQVKLLDFTSSELDMVCENVNRFTFDESIAIERVPPIISNYLALSNKIGVRCALILHGITKLFHLLEKRRLEEDYHESQTGTQSLRAISTQQLRETENLVFITFEQFFASHPNFALEFINNTKHSIAKGGLYLFSLGLLLTISKNDRLSKFADKAMQTLLQWSKSTRTSSDLSNQPSSSTTSHSRTTGNSDFPENPSSTAPNRAENSTNASIIDPHVSFIDGHFVPIVLQSARPIFENLTQNQRLVEASKVSLGPLSLVTHKSLVTACLEGWDACVSGLVEMAFNLIDLDLEDLQRTSKTTSKQTRNVPILEEAGYFSKEAAHILCSLFEGVESVRARILDETFLAVLSRAEVSLLHVMIIERILYTNRSKIAPYLPKFQELVHQIGSLPPLTTKALIRALDPILASHPDFKDNLIMVLRKASFSHDTTARSSATCGFIQQLRGHLSALTSTHTLSPPLVEQMALECLSFVRRSLAQQAFIRAALYRELAGAYNDALGRRMNVLDSMNSERTRSDNNEEMENEKERKKENSAPSRYAPGTLETLDTILEAIVELFLFQLSTVTTEDEEGLKFEISNCIRSRESQSYNTAKKLGDTSVPIVASKEIQEPLHVLLMASNCLIYGESIRGNGLSVKNGHSILIYRYLDRFVQFMLHSELEQFELDKSSDFSFDTPEGLGNQESATILLGVYEMCIEYLLTIRTAAQRRSSSEQTENLENVDSEWITETEEEAQDRYKNIHKLFKMLLQLKGLVKEAKGSIKLIHPKSEAAAAHQKESEIEDVEEEDSGNKRTKTSASGGAKAASKTKQIFSRPSLLSRQCIVDLLTLLCNPIKTSTRRDANNQIVATPLSNFANDFSVVQYVLSVALSTSQSLPMKSKGKAAQDLIIEYAIDGLARNTHGFEFLEKIAGFLLYEASSAQSLRITPLGAKKTNILALEIYVEGLKYVTQRTNFNASILAKFASSSVAYMLSNREMSNKRINTGKNSETSDVAMEVDGKNEKTVSDLVRQILASGSNAESKVSFFVELVQSFVTKEMCFANPTEAELWLTIVELVAPQLAPKHLRTIALWVESLISLDSTQSSQDEERKMTNEIGLKLIPFLWSLLDRCGGDEIKSSYLMLARDCFVTCGGNAATSKVEEYILEDEERMSSHVLTFSVTARSTVSNVAIALIEHIDTRIKMIEAIHAEIENSEKFVIVDGDGVLVEEEKHAREEDSESSDSDSSQSEVEMGGMLNDENLSATIRATQQHKASSSDERAIRPSEEEEDYGEVSMNVHLKRKSVIYKDCAEICEIYYCLVSTMLPSTANIALAKSLDKFFKMTHTWIAARLKRKKFEPVVAAFEAFVSNLGLLFGRVHVWVTSWTQGGVPFIPMNDEKKKTKLISAARTAASKHVPSLVFWMERIHVEDLIKLAARADHPQLLKNFKNHSQHDFTFREGAFAEKMLSRKRTQNGDVSEYSDLHEARPKAKREKKKKN